MLGDGRVETLALDLEGTLILFAGNPIPRPGLFEFLEFCRATFPRLVVYSGVDERSFRILARDLVLGGAAPEWFPELPHCWWDYHNVPYKDLRLIDGADLEHTAIVDDLPQAIDPDQVEHWVYIEPFRGPGTVDGELDRVKGVLAGMAGGDGKV